MAKLFFLIILSACSKIVLSPQQTPTASSFSKDTSAPIVTITNPGSGNVSGTITISANASDNVGVVGVQFKLDGSNYGVEDVSPPYSIIWDTTTASNQAHTLTATARDAAGNSATSSSVIVNVNNSGNPSCNVQSGNFITTPYDSIPNFAANPTIVSVQNGNWSDPSTWSSGRIPTDNDIVNIYPYTTVQYDVASTARLKTVAVQPCGNLNFKNDTNTTLYLANLLILSKGQLTVGTEASPISSTVSASIIFLNQALDTSVDPNQYGNGFIALGKVTMFGVPKANPFIRLSAEARAGQTTVNLSQPASGWKSGDKIIFPDSRQITDYQLNTGAVIPQLEVLSVSSVSTNGLAVTLSNPLQYDHLGARNATSNTLEYLPHAINYSRNVIVKSESSTGVRAHVFFTYRADINIHYVQFGGLGRTKSGVIDNTSGSHIGTNQEDRNPVQFAHLFGPAAPQTNGYQYTFIGNSIFCPLNPMPFVWGLNIKDSHYGLIKDNVLYNWAGSSLVTKTGSESYNVIDHNIAVKTTGDAQRQDDNAQAGTGFWFRGVLNYVRNNIATNINTLGSDIYSYGFNYYLFYAGTVNIPIAQGADASIAGQTFTVDLNKTAILEFRDNEVYGATASGISLWWINTFNDSPYASAQESIIQNFTVWHHRVTGMFIYPVHRVTVDNMKVRGNVGNLSDAYFNAKGIYFNDYMGHDIIIQNADIQGLGTGIVPPYMVGRGGVLNTTVIRNSYLANMTNITVSPPRSVNGSGDLNPKKLNVENVVFTHSQGTDTSRWVDVDMDYVVSDTSGQSNLNVSDLVYVYSYNGNATDKFQAFYNQNSPPNAVNRNLIRGKVVPLP